MPETAPYAMWGPRYHKGYYGQSGKNLGGRLIGWEQYNKPLFAAKLRWSKLQSVPHPEGTLRDIRHYGGGMIDFYRERMHKGFLRRDLAEVGIRRPARRIAQGARSAYGFMNIRAGGGLNALGREAAGYLGPMGLAAGVGAGVGVTAALGAGDVANLGPAAAAGAAMGAGGGFLAWRHGGSLLKMAGRSGLSAAGVAGGGLEVLFGAGSRTARRGAELLATGGIRGGTTVMSRLGAGGVAGAIIGGLAGGSGGSALMGGALGAGFGMSLGRMGTGGISRVMARHPIAALTMAAVGLSALKGGRKVAEQAMAQDHPSYVAPGSWSEVYGLPSNHMSTAGIGLAAHYRRR